MDPRSSSRGEADGPHGTRAAETSIDATRALAGLRARGVTEDVVHIVEVHGSLPSTNAAALEDARAGLVLVALEQREGRGRSGARWASPPGGLYLTFVPPVALVPARPTDATLLAGLAVADAVDAVLALVPAGPRRHAGLKWPNDILLGGAKVAGVLVQARGASVPGPEGARTVVGIGINVNAGVVLPPPPGPPDHPTAATLPPVSLSAALERALALEPLLVDVVSRLVERLAEGLTDTAVGDYRRRCETLGTRVAFTDGTGRVEALAVDVDIDGALVVEVDGRQRRVTSGEVRHLRGKRHA
jgi:BirA family biotin operon repressor/biotin-[acetyl-CoA-carboxylase] ligase